MSVSLRRASQRKTVTPMTTSPPAAAWKRRLDRGMRISTNQPSPVRATATSQNVFQLRFMGIVVRVVHLGVAEDRGVEAQAGRAS